MMMKRIYDYKEVSPLILKYFKRGVITNNFLGAEDYKAEIDEGRLFYDSEVDFLNVYVKRDGFYQLYFHALSENVKFPDVGESVITEVVGNGRKIIENNGYKKILERVKLEIDTENEPNVAGIKSTLEDSEEIYAVLKNSFNIYTGYIPNFTETKRESQEGLFYKYIEDGKIAGILRMGKNGKSAQIKHLCVLEKFRGKGIAKILVKEFLAENPKAIVWTGKENEPALNLYKSLGFLKSETESTVYRKDV